MRASRPGILTDQATTARKPASREVTPVLHRAGVQTVALVTLAVLAVFYTLSVAADVILPFLLAVVLNLLLQPPMRLLRERLRLPASLAALVVIVLLFGLLATIGAAISVPAADWLARIPQSLPRLQQQLKALDGPIQYAQHGMEQIRHLLAAGGQGAAPPANAAAAGGQPAGGGVSLPSGLGGVGLSLLLGTQHFFSRLFMLVIVLFFLLASGDSLLRNLVDVMPNWNEKRRVVVIAHEIEAQVSGYLVTITLMNLLVGVANGLSTWACGMPNPLLWGTLAFLLNYVPILGPLTGVVVFFFVGLFTFNVVWFALLPPGIYLLIHMLEGETLTPMLLARRFTLNPVIIIVSLFFWDWIWGVPGALLSVPLLAICKIVCDHIPSLAPLGHMLGAAKHRLRAGARAV